eukprot:PhM_4_TR18089/c0_g1_i1/m.106270
MLLSTQRAQPVSPFVIWLQRAGVFELRNIAAVAMGADALHMDCVRVWHTCRINVKRAHKLVRVPHVRICVFRRHRHAPNVVEPRAQKVRGEVLASGGGELVLARALLQGFVTESVPRAETGLYSKARNIRARGVAIGALHGDDDRRLDRDNKAVQLEALCDINSMGTAYKVHNSVTHSSISRLERRAVAQSHTDIHVAIMTVVVERLLAFRDESLCPRVVAVKCVDNGHLEMLHHLGAVEITVALNVDGLRSHEATQRRPGDTQAEQFQNCLADAFRVQRRRGALAQRNAHLVGIHVYDAHGIHALHCKSRGPFLERLLIDNDVRNVRCYLPHDGVFGAANCDLD